MFNFGGSSNGPRTHRVKSNSIPTGVSPREVPADRYIIIDELGETEVDSTYIDMLVKEEALYYDGCFTDTYGAKIYRFLLVTPGSIDNFTERFLAKRLTAGQDAGKVGTTKATEGTSPHTNT